jgi:Ig-like domain-containing protein/helix-turn-helix protein
MAVTRADAVEGFAAVLRELRESAGNPSFRQMSGRSRAISHTTLHEAAQGNRLPSWPTTVEFVKACGADPAAYLERWETANRANQAAAEPQAPPTPAVASAPAEGETAGAPAEPRRHRRRLALAAIGAAVVVAAGVTVAVIAAGSDSPDAPTGGTGQPTAGRYSAADCPVHATNPPPAPPAHSGDASVFIDDITLPDCSHLRRGQTASKVWRLKNVGTVPWTGYSLHRLDLPQRRDQCQTITDVPIPDTAPGHAVDIRTTVTAPATPAFCVVRFKMLDAAGEVAFPGSRPVNFQLFVD